MTTTTKITLIQVLATTARKSPVLTAATASSSRTFLAENISTVAEK